MIAHALLAILAAGHADQPRAADMITSTCNEIRRLFTILIVEPARTTACPLAWSAWRRRHQHRARACPYHRREAEYQLR
jgi:hypothetical protein